MIFDQAIAQSCGFCLQGGVQVFSAEGLERRFESGVQQIVISDSVASASLLNQLSMQHENLLSFSKYLVCFFVLFHQAF